MASTFPVVRNRQRDFKPTDIPRGINPVAPDVVVKILEAQDARFIGLYNRDSLDPHEFQEDVLGKSIWLCW